MKCIIGTYMSVVDDNDCNAATRPTDTQVRPLCLNQLLTLGKTSQELSQNRSPFIGKYVGRGNSRLTKLFWIYLCVTFWISFFDVVLLSSLFFWIVCRFWFWFWIVCRFLILILPRWWRLTLCAGFLELRFFFF